MRKAIKMSEELKKNLRRSLTDISKIPKATIKPTARDLGWAAGFIEGEGSFNNSRTSGQIHVSQVNPDPLVKLQALFGGRIRRVEKKSPHQSQWRWIVSGARARGVMLTLYKLLSYRRQMQIKAVFNETKYSE